MLTERSMRTCLLYGAVLTILGCATAPDQTGKETSAEVAASGRLPDQELRRQHACEQIRAQLAVLGVNPARDPFSYPAYRNRELGDPNSPITEIQRLQIDYQRNQCHFR